MSSKNNWIKWFDENAKNNENPMAKMAYCIDGKPIDDEYLLDDIVKDIMKKLQPKNSKILEIGCGVGHFTKRLNNIVAIDSSFNMVTYASKQKRGNYLVCDASHLPFRNSTFDNILCYSVLHYLGSLDIAKDTISEFKRVAKTLFLGDIPRDTGVKKKSLTFQESFFIENYDCKILYQEIPRKATAKDRFDVILQ